MEQHDAGISAYAEKIMKETLATLRIKIQALLARHGGINTASPTIVRPIRDWKAVLLGLSIIIICFGFFALLPYAGLLNRSIETPTPAVRAVKIDMEGLKTVADLLVERRLTHSALIQTAHVFVDPGR